jgi:hypothetical protein
VTAFEYDAIRDKTQRTLVGFLTAEIDLGLTLTRSAVNAYDAGRTEYFSEAKEKATKAYHTVKRFVAQVANGKIRQDIEARLVDLERAIAAL